LQPRSLFSHKTAKEKVPPNIEDNIVKHLIEKRNFWWKRNKKEVKGFNLVFALARFLQQKLSLDETFRA
jgi:hypothetical protein